MSDFEAIETIVGPARLKRTKRKTLAISVHPDGSVELVAPARAAIHEIQAKVAKRVAWIQKQQRAFAEMNAARQPRRYVSGATHRYMGRQYRLRVIKGEEASVRLLGGFFHITAPSGTEKEVERLLSAWMRRRAEEQFTKRIRRWHDWCAQYRLPLPRMVLRSMPKRWGSASRDGRIALNPALIRAPSVCIDYVIAHEVCHLRHPHHGPEFLRELDQIFSGWRSVKARLESAPDL